MWDVCIVPSTFLLFESPVRILWDDRNDTLYYALLEVVHHSMFFY
jgi:hypothetical protein